MTPINDEEIAQLRSQFLPGLESLPDAWPFGAMKFLARAFERIRIAEAKPALDSTLKDLDAANTAREAALALVLTREQEIRTLEGQARVARWLGEDPVRQFSKRQWSRDAHARMISEARER